ncbi:DgyrCDS7485 [Dimorphilus gyrociliatus]|uniref:DgyrCDS7485 n=1 Tax=Dimorphilus gyrociliatus TaxID=2664684 RepID=A0A7I8VSW1_9ANNE|nr:DgyrCDS7485 [Dimorphilus gyrociliatus]
MDDILRLDSYSVALTNDRNDSQYLIIPSSWINQDENTFWYIDTSDNKELETIIRTRIAPNDDRTKFNWVKYKYNVLNSINIDSYEEAKKYVTRKQKANNKVNNNRNRLTKRKASESEEICRKKKLLETNNEIVKELFEESSRKEPEGKLSTKDNKKKETVTFENNLLSDSELDYYVLEKLLYILQTIKHLHQQSLQLQKLCKTERGEIRTGMVDLDKSLSDEKKNRRGFFSSLTKMLKKTEEKKIVELETILQTLNLPITNLQHFREKFYFSLIRAPDIKSLVRHALNRLMHVQFAQNVRLNDNCISSESENEKIVFQEWPIFEPFIDGLTTNPTATEIIEIRDRLVKILHLSSDWFNQAKRMWRQKLMRMARPT